MSRFGPDVWYTFEGEVETVTQKAIRFQADNWSAPEWVPLSQCEYQPLGGGRAKVKIKEWLCKKNGWSENGEPLGLDDEVPF